MLLIFISGSWLGCQNNLKHTHSPGFQKEIKYLKSNLKSNFVFLFKKTSTVLKLENISFIKNSRQYPTGDRPDEINNPTLQFFKVSRYQIYKKLFKKLSNLLTLNFPKWQRGYIFPKMCQQSRVSNLFSVPTLYGRGHSPKL